MRLVKQVVHTHRATSHLIFVRRSDSAPRSADFLGAQGRFTGLIQGYVIRQEQSGIAGNTNTGFGLDTFTLEFCDFGKKRFRRKHNAVTDVARLIGVHDTRGNEA